MTGGRQTECPPRHACLLRGGLVSGAVLVEVVAHHAAAVAVRVNRMLTVDAALVVAGAHFLAAVFVAVVVGAVAGNAVMWQMAAGRSTATLRRSSATHRTTLSVKSVPL